MSHFWVVIPAAGVGKRMLADRPKQYLLLNRRTILEHTLEKFLTHKSIAGVVVVVSRDDEYWPELQIQHPRLTVAHGGVERCHSVLNGLLALESLASEDDWVLVHDAARPCVRQEDIGALIEQLKNHPVGGLLGLPVADTLKLCDKQGVVQRTVSRDLLWRALTPQMFRLQALIHAITQALEQQQLVTDEASAIELTGRQPQMVEGHPDNIKITVPQDMALAEMFLRQQQEQV
jgi:2-C-methyl-D-erythritol 4-phosphate cytidylyltransferase